MKQNIEIVTFATHEEGTLNDLVHNQYNVPIKVLGFGEKWTGFKMKFEYVYDYIQTLPENDIVVFLDGFDSEIKGNVKYLPPDNKNITRYCLCLYRINLRV